MSSKSILVNAISIVVGVFAACAAHAQEVHLARNEKATEQAIAALIVTDIYKRSGLTAKIQPMPGARANAVSTGGEKDGEVGRITAYFVKNPALVKVEPAYYYITTTVFAKADRNISVTSKDDLAKYKIGIIRGVQHTETATQGLSGVQVVNDAEQLYQMLDAGRFDIALDAGVNGPYVTKKLGLTGIKAVGDIAKLDLFMVLNGSKKDIAAKLGATVKSLKDSGELEKIAKKHEQEFLSSGAPN